MRISDWSSDVCSSDLIARPGIVRRDRQRIAAVAIEHPLEIARAELDVVIGIDRQRRRLVLEPDPVGDLARRPRYQLHQPARPNLTHRRPNEPALLPPPRVSAAANSLIRGGSLNT